MEAVVDPANLETAWKNVKANRGAPGPDGITIAEFPDWLRPRWPEIRQQLLDGTYRPSPVRRKAIDKPDGGQRLLGIPNVIERLIQQAIVQVLTPIFDPHFSESSFGFRPKRSAHGAAKQVRRIIRRGHRFAADVDLSKFFDRVQHDVLSRVVTNAEFEFLGFTFVKSRATINVAPKSVHKFKQRIRKLTGRSWGVSMERRLSELRSYVRGWMGYFKVASQLKLFDKPDQWIGRRIRMCYWKPWRRPKRRREMLIRLGAARRQAIRHARSRKGYWHMAKTIASGVGLANAWLAEQGLLSMKTLWAQLAPLR